jgi:hypothetical protein
MHAKIQGKASYNFNLNNWDMTARQEAECRKTIC